MRAKLEAFRTKKEVIKAQYSAAEAQVRISEAATGVGEQMADVGLAMQRALDKTENMKARAAAVGELEASGTFDDLTQLGPGKDDIDRQLEAIGAGGAVDDELAKLKAELGSGSPRRRRSAPATPAAPAEPSGRAEPRAPRTRDVIVRDLQRRAVPHPRRRRGAPARARRGGASTAVDAGDEAAFTRELRGAHRLHPRERRAARRRRSRALRPHAAAGRHHARGGPRGVHRRGPDPGLSGRWRASRQARQASRAMPVEARDGGARCSACASAGA